MEPFVDLGYEQVCTYEAISYTWGHSTEKAIIRLNGRRVWVPRNVYDMLLGAPSALAAPVPVD